MAKRKYQRNGKKAKKAKWPILVILLLALVIGAGGFFAHRFDNEPIQVVIAGADISDLSSEDATELLTKNHSWDMKVTYEGKTFPVENYIEPEIQSVVAQAEEEKQKLETEKKTLSIVQKALRGLQGKKADTLEYELQIADSENLAKTIAETIEEKWSVPAKDSEITGFDAENGNFEYSDEQEGIEINAEKLAEDLKNAFDTEDYQASITTSANKVAPEISRSDYKKIGTYTTNTTANPDRNTNVRLASEAINGYVVEAGAQFSFNDVVGERTPEKGYKEAAAYAADEVVQEYGGGVCQVSSTLYNAVIAAGLQTDVRTGHTFKPTYVTPGQDATVSYREPDFVFTNNSSNSIGIRASYWDQTVCVEIYGIPILEEGVVRYLVSEKKCDLDAPSATYEEDTSLPYGEEVTVSAEEPGSEWITDIVTEKDGQIISQEFFHNTRYKGKAAVIKRNTTVKDSDKDKDKDKDKKKDKNKDKDKKTEESTETETEAPAPDPDPEPAETETAPEKNEE